ncbi:unnamed protein product, partial [Prorocentrum cordatum]
PGGCRIFGLLLLNGCCSCSDCERELPPSLGFVLLDFKLVNSAVTRALPFDPEASGGRAAGAGRGGSAVGGRPPGRTGRRCSCPCWPARRTGCSRSAGWCGSSCRTRWPRRLRASRRARCCAPLARSWWPRPGSSSPRSRGRARWGAPAARCGGAAACGPTAAPGTKEPPAPSLP